MMNKTTDIKGFLVKQFTRKPIATTSIKFSDLMSFVKFTARESNAYDPYDPVNKNDSIVEDVNEQYFQRLTNEKRVKNIYEFLLKEINNINSESKFALGSFPTAILISLDIDEEFSDKNKYIKFIENLDKDDKVGAFYEMTNDEEIRLTIPNRKISLIVDGQHRLAAMLKLLEDAKKDSIKIGRETLLSKYPNISNKIVIDSLESFQLNCTFLIGFDIWEQGKVFADVNFNQKPVNKSLYYDIFGSFPDTEKNDIFLAHMLAMHLNNNDKSVIKGYIKMLGTGKGFFSQAFFVEAILGHFKPSGIWGTIPQDYRKGKTNYKILPKFLRAYFKTISTVFADYWPKERENTSRSYKNILVKTTGMGALIKLINPIYLDLLRQGVDMEKITYEELLESLTGILIKLKPKGKDFFSKESDYAGAGSLGLQDKLYKEMGTELKYFNK